MRRTLAVILFTAVLGGFASRASALPNYTITSESGTVMYTDIGNGLNATYLVFQITKHNSGSDATVWAQLDTSASSIISNVGTGQHLISAWNPSTGAHGTAPTADGDGFDLGETKGAFFLVKASSTTTTNQSLTVNLFSSCSDTSAPGCANGTLSGSLGTATFQFTVADTIKASANKVNTVITIPNNPQIGQLGNITVTGCTGTVGAGKVLYFSPVSEDSWPADAFEFIDSDIQIDNYAGSPYRDIALIPNGDVLTTNNCYDEIFTFVIQAVGTANTSPSNFIDSGGTNIKHTTNTSGSFSVVIPPAQCNTITVDLLGGSFGLVVPGQPFSAVFEATPSPQVSYTFTASGLPSWLSLDPSTGILSGTPTFADVGTVSFTVTATDTGTDPSGCTGQAQFSFDVVCPTVNVLSVPCCSFNDAVVGVPYTITFSGDPAGTYTFSAIGLPAWLSLDPTTGVLNGTPGPGDVGLVNFTVVATETSSQCQGRRVIAFAVDPAAPAVPTLGGAGLALLALTLAGAAFFLIRRG